MMKKQIYLFWWSIYFWLWSFHHHMTKAIFFFAIAVHVSFSSRRPSSLHVGLTSTPHQGLPVVYPFFLLVQWSQHCYCLCGQRTFQIELYDCHIGFIFKLENNGWCGAIYLLNMSGCWLTRAIELNIKLFKGGQNWACTKMQKKKKW